MNAKNYQKDHDSAVQEHQTASIPDYAPETARLPETQKIKLHSEDGQYVEKAIKRIGPALDKICQDNHWHIDALMDNFDEEYFPSKESFSRVLNNSGKRRISAGQLLELRRVAGISLDKLADGCDPFEFQQMPNELLIALMHQISTELSRRIWQQ